MKLLSTMNLKRLTISAIFAALVVIGSPTTVQAQEVSVPLGQYGGTATLVRTSSGGYTWNGQTVVDGSIVTGSNRLRYVLTVTGSRPTARYLPRLASVPLGTAGGSITLTQRETGDFWWGGAPVQSGLNVTAADGATYRLTFANNEWTANAIATVLRVALGHSGESVALTRLPDGSYSYGGSRLREGRTVRDSAGNLYRFELRNGAWRASLATAGPPPPPGGTGSPNPSPVLRSDVRDTYVGVRPVLATSAEGVRGSVLRVGGQEYSVYELFRDGGVTLEPTFAEYAAGRIETIRSQVDTLVELLADDPAELADALQLRWTAAQRVLDTFFGRTAARNVFGTLPRRSNTRVDVNAVAARLDDVHAALSDFREFHYAVDRGVLGGVVDLDDTDEAFDAVHSTTALKFDTTLSTRFGVYARQERDSTGRWSDDLELVTGDSGFGTFAYSPLDASERADLPRHGQAEYVGRTVAIAVDDPATSYSGELELNVRFSSNRVGALIRNLQTASGRRWRYSYAEVESIVLPDATLDSRDASFETTSANSRASVNYPAFAGSPPQRLVTSEMKGQVLGEGTEAGSAAIGTWELKASSTRTLIAGAFGVEYQSTSMANRPAISDSGQVSRTYLGARPQLGRGHRCRRLGSERIQHFVLCRGPVRNRVRCVRGRFNDVDSQVIGREAIANTRGLARLRHRRH